MTLLMNLTTILTAISAISLLLLISVYLKNLKKIKSIFTIGLVTFALLFLMQNLVSLYFYFTMMQYYTPEVEIHVFIFTLLQIIAFVILLKITYE